MTFQDHVIKCYFGKIANLKSITTNNYHARTCSMQLYRQTHCYFIGHFCVLCKVDSISLLNIIMFYVKLIL